MLFRFFMLLLCFFTINTHAQDDYYDDYGYDEEYADEYGYDDGYDDGYDEEYADEYADEDIIDENIETPEVIEPNIISDPRDPLFILHTYSSPLFIDPANPKLPANHKISRLKGTVWKSDYTVLKTNRAGVVSEQRLFIFFDKERDAISYRYAIARDRDIPVWPEDSLFIALNPLLQTNDSIPQTPYRPQRISSGTNTQYTIDLLQMRNYRYEDALESLITNLKIMTNTIQEITTNTITNISTVSQSSPSSDEYFNTHNENNFLRGFNDSHENEIYDNHISYIPIRFLAQDLSQETTLFIENLGGGFGGIFVHKTGDRNFPYKVILLQLDPSGTYLYEANLDMFNDINNLSQEENQKLRDSYYRMLQEKTNMQRYQRVKLDRQYLY